MIECVDKFTFYLLGRPRMCWPQCWTSFSHFPEFLDWSWSFLMINIFRYSCRYYLINYNIRQLISYMVYKQTRGVCKMSQRRRFSQGCNYRQLSQKYSVALAVSQFTIKLEFVQWPESSWHFLSDAFYLIKKFATQPKL